MTSVRLISMENSHVKKKSIWLIKWSLIYIYMYASILDYRYNKQKANSKADWDGKKIKKQKETYGNKTPKRIGLGDVKNPQKQIIFRLDTNIIKVLLPPFHIT